MPNSNDRNALPALMDKGSVGSRGMQINSPQDLTLMAQMVHKSGLAPRGLDTIPKIAVAMQTGMEVGLPPMASLSGIAVIGGRPCIWGDNATGLVNGSGEVAEWEEWYELDGQRIKRAPSEMADDLTAVCMIQRRGRISPVYGSFSVSDARRARLWGKSGPWSEYPSRMLMWRARSWAMRDGFSDVLKGIGIVEEVRDTPVEVPVEHRTIASIGPKQDPEPETPEEEPVEVEVEVDEPETEPEGPEAVVFPPEAEEPYTGPDNSDLFRD